MSFHLVTTDHLSDRLWFKDTQDFVVAMNIVAVLSLRMNVSILAFILMSNHVHFVLAEDKAKALKFITEFKRLFSWYLTNKYGKREQLRRNDVDIRELSAYDESLERAIAEDPERAKKYSELLYSQALLIADLPLEDPSAYTDLVCELMK